MKIEKQPFGQTKNGEATDLYTLSNDSGTHIKITNYGGIITDIIVPDRSGKLENIVAGFDSVKDYQSPAYLAAMPYFGAIIGRYANRINKGKFSIDGQLYHVPQNLGEVALHGGISGFDKKIWKAKTAVTEEQATLILHYLSADLEEGFPGNLEVEVRYSWTAFNELEIEYLAKTDQPTHLNLTNHSYFNLNGFQRDILDHKLTIKADFYTEVDELNVPTGNLSPVMNSYLDFSTPQEIGARIDEAEGAGYDHNYVINGKPGDLKLAAIATDPSSGRRMTLYTTEPGVQLYTANYLDGSLKRGDVDFTRSMAFCLETQHFPDSPNQSAFPSTLLRPGATFQSRTLHKFDTV